MAVRILVTLFAALSIAALCALPAAYASDVNGVGVEQIHADLPEIRVYYREADPPAVAGDFEVSLDRGAFDGIAPQTETGFEPDGCMYVFLVDVSTSVSSRQMSAIKRALRDFYTASVRRERDLFVLIPFGNRVYDAAEDGRGFLGGGESESEALAAIDLLNRSDGQTAFYDAIHRARAMATGFVGSPERKVIVALSDGDDDPKDKDVGKHYSYDDILGEASIGYGEAGIPIYALGLETEAVKDIERFRSISEASKGVFYKSVSEADLAERFAALTASLTRVRMMRLRSDELSADSAGYALRIRFGGADLLSPPVEIKPSVPDVRPPAVVGDIEPLPDIGGIRVHFDEALDAAGAERAENYVVKDSGGDSVPVQGVQYALENGGSRSDILFERNPYSGVYTLHLSGLTDASKNPLDAAPISFDYEGEALGFKYLRTVFVDFWWVVLIIALAAAAAVILRISYGILKKRKGLVQIEGKIGFGDMVEYKHVFETPETKKLCLIVTDMRGDAQKTELNVHKSAFVGRAKSNNLSFDDESMSRQHFVIEAEGDAFFITDLQTTNGTFLNGVRINEKRRLAYNDVITAGHEKFVFKA
ncbi:MAG: FHA domain-containing protein [Clostridiales Family XIII bacterium]|jgi:hypothetical protein|nr:FHA domain-containing protein [Clostridiales Family XIII bacterium]